MDARVPAPGRPESCIAQPDPGESLPSSAEAEEGVPPSFDTPSDARGQRINSSYRQPETEPEPELEQGLRQLAVAPLAGPLDLCTDVQRVVQRTTELVRDQETITYTRVKRALLEEFGEAAFGEAAEEVRQMLKIAESVRADGQSDQTGAVAARVSAGTAEANQLRLSSGIPPRTPERASCEGGADALLLSPGGTPSGIREESLPKGEWVSDSYVQKCESCGKKFGITTRRHHCRCCGRVFCQACSGKKFGFAVPWQWESATGWRQYGCKVEQQLNEASSQGQAEVQLQIGPRNYTINFEAATQVNAETKRKRSIRGGGQSTQKERVCDSCYAALSAGRGSVQAASEWRRKAKWEVQLDSGWIEYGHRQSQDLELAYQYDVPWADVSIDDQTAAPFKYKVDLYHMYQQNVTHQARRKRAVRRTGPPGKLKLSQHASSKAKFQLDQFRRHCLSNASGEVLELQPLKSHPQGGRWFEPPPGYIPDGGIAEWTSVGQSGDISYRMMSSKAEVVLQLGLRPTYYGFIQPHHSKPHLADSASDEIVDGISELPHCRLPTTNARAKHHWIVKQRSVEQPPTQRQGGEPIWKPMELQTLEEVGTGSTHIAVSWASTLQVRTNFSEDDLQRPPSLYTPKALSAVLPQIQAGEHVVAVDSSNPEWTRVRRVGEASVDTGISNGTECSTQLLPTCVLEPACPELGWEVELCLNSKGAKPVVISSPEGQRPFGSLFELDTARDDSIGIGMEYRPAHVLGCWQAIVRGLKPLQIYRLRVRAVLKSALKPGEDRACHGEWSEPLVVSTLQNAPPSLDWWGKTQFKTIDSCVEVGAKGPMARKLGCPLQRRWLRIRPRATMDGIDVLWRLKPTQRLDSTWRVKVSLESNAPSTDEDVVVLSSGRTDISPRVVEVEGTEIHLCGSVYARQGQVIRLEWESAGNETEAQKEEILNFSYSVLASQPSIEVVQKQTTDPRSSFLKGRFLHLSNQGKHVSACSLQVYDHYGALVEPVNVACSSILKESTNYTFPPSNAVDSSLATFACTRAVGQHIPQWLRVDLGEEINIKTIKLVNRIDENPQRGISRPLGTTVKVTSDRRGQDVRWESQLLKDQLIHRFEFCLPRSATAVPSPTPPAVSSDATIHSGAQTAMPCLDYPPSDFLKLERLLETVISQGMELPTSWMSVDGEWSADVPGVMMPFTRGQSAQRALEAKVYKRFSSQAKPHWIKLRGPDGKVVDAVLKTGDDLRQDQLVLGMLRRFNEIWAEEGVTHTTISGKMCPVSHPIYDVVTVGPTKGLVEMLPDSVPVDEVAADESRARSGWRASNEMVPSAVATFIGAYVLNIRDRHKGNMVITGGKALANIDFGWLGEAPAIDTGMFPIPDGLRMLLKTQKLWEEFLDLCWDAVEVLHCREKDILACWKDILVDRELNDRWLDETAPEHMKERLRIPRENLDSAIVTGGGSLKTFLKNLTHARHAGAQAVFRVVSEAMLGVGDVAVPDSIDSPDPVTVNEPEPE